MSLDSKAEMHRKLIEATLGADTRPATVVVVPRREFEKSKLCAGKNGDCIDAADRIGDFGDEDGLDHPLRVLGFADDQEGRGAVDLLKGLKDAAFYTLDSQTMTYAPQSQPCPAREESDIRWGRMMRPVTPLTTKFGI